MEAEDKKRRRRRKCCFSLIEIMIVVLIIGMVMGLVTPNVLKHLRNARIKNTKIQIELLANAVDDYYLDLSEFPAKLDDLVVNSGNQKWDGPYLKKGKLPVDAWGESFQYDPSAQDGQYNIYSYGSDKAPGGTGEGKDIHYLDDEE